MEGERSEEKHRSFRRLPRAFRLKRQRLIRALFDRRRVDVGTLTRGCIRLVYRIVPRVELGTSAPIQAGFAPGRIPLAASRNRIKRQLREVYRVHQDDLVGLFSDRDVGLTLMIIYRGNADAGAHSGERIRTDLPILLRGLYDRVSETSPSAERRE